MNPLIRRSAAAASACLVGLLGGTAGVVPAGAVAPSQPVDAQVASAAVGNTDGVRVTSWKYLDGLQTCAKVTVTGKLTYTAQHFGPFPAGAFTDEWRITRTRLVAPKTTVSLYAYDPGTHGCTTSPVRKDLKFTVGFSAYSCKWNPSLAVNVPLSVGINFWPDCRNHKVAKGSVNKHNVTHASLYDQDLRVRFGNQTVYTNGGKPSFHCVGVLVRTTAGNASGDDVRVSTGRKKICLTPKF
jgi:hypothetical protein